MIFIVIELQTTTDGTVGTFVFSFSTRYAAEAKYHDILSKAAASTVYKHGCVMLTEEGTRLKSECYTHKSEPEPEPEPTGE